MTTPGPTGPRSNRFHACLPASFEAGGRGFDCVAHNLSRSGSLLVGRFPPPAEATVVVTFLPPAGDLRLTLRARVVRREVEAAENRIAVEFVDVPERDQATLEALIARVIEGQSPAALEGLGDHATPQEIRTALEGIPLAHRIQLALRAQARERQVMTHDGHPQVLDALARNPHLLPQELMTLLRLPLVPPHTLDAIARDSRWAGSEPIAVAVATHRNTPHATAERILAALPLAALQKMIQTSSLSPALREKALKRLPRRA